MFPTMPRLRYACLFVLVHSLAGLGQERPALERQSIRLRVLLPAADAQLFVDKQPTWQRGSTRVFTTPPLEPGEDYYYTLTTIWEPNNYTTFTRIAKSRSASGRKSLLT